MGKGKKRKQLRRPPEPAKALEGVKIKGPSKQQWRANQEVLEIANYYLQVATPPFGCGYTTQQRQRAIGKVSEWLEYYMDKEIKGDDS